MKNAPSSWIPKELSWLSFNERVLQEAQDKSVPVVERVRFLGIYSSNLDEYFKVKIADLKRRVVIDEENDNDSGAKEVLKQCLSKVKKLNDTFDNTYSMLLTELSSHNIFLYDEKQITEEQRVWVTDFFRRNVLKHISPVILNDSIDLVSFLKDKYAYLLVKMTRKGHKEGREKSQDRDGSNSVTYALIEIPTDKIPRFIQIPTFGNKKEKVLMILDNVIRIGLDLIFKGLFNYDEISAYSAKMNRDAEYDLSSQMDRSFVENMSQSLKQRLVSMPVRFAYDKEMPKEMVRYIVNKLCMQDFDSVMEGGRYHNFKDFTGFPNVGRDYIENTPLPELNSTDFDAAANAFEAISAHDILLYYPYHSFRYFTELLRQASYDPAVTAIKINIYRVASKSRVISSLIDAANNGKHVTVIVELKARFDEENNIKWASRLTDAGVKVLFGMPSLKIHSKLCLITRIEDGQPTRYAHIGTGNFNEKTAKIYTDFALFTKHPELTQEVAEVFTFIEFPYIHTKFDRLLVSPINARRKITDMIENEINNARSGFTGKILVKINNLVDKELIDELYKASQAGVQIDMIIRGMCSLRPGIPGLSENIRIISIVDRFLEHPRVMYFYNNGNPRLFISSADWMSRNLDTRIEVGTPILSPILKNRIMDILNIQFQDTMKARIIDSEQTNTYVKRGNRRKLRSQIAIYDYLAKNEEKKQEKRVARQTQE
ncbi:polyphosphate kinase 1 [Succinimonas amylolytica]|uniref:polyphosphate kinase 1 n=1 Tax=Succinimonas amylolytica TaxID=83769 RepID=UPI0023A7E815